MNYVFVKFSGTEKNYIYKTKLNLIEGAAYKIVADGITTYASPVKICSVVSTRPNFGGVIREITTAEIITAPPRPKVTAKFIINKEKGYDCCSLERWYKDYCEVSGWRFF